MVGVASQSRSFEGESGAGYDNFNIVNDGELQFTVTTVLDNGVKISTDVEINVSQADSSLLDASNIHFYTKFGTFYTGTTFGPIFVLGTQISPPGAVNALNCDFGDWIVRPTGSNSVSSTFCGATVPASNKNMKAAYVSNMIYDTLAFGVGYTPSTTNTDAPPAVGGDDGTETQQYEASFVFLPKLGPWQLRSDVGIWQNQGTETNSYYGIRGGVDISLRGLGFVATAAKIKPNAPGVLGTSNSQEEESYSLGANYSTDSYSIGIAYLKNEQPRSSSVAGSDTIDKIFLGLSVPVGPSVEFLASLFHVRLEDEGGLSNSGAAFVTGINVGF